jgi:hypothetical protein
MHSQSARSARASEALARGLQVGTVSLANQEPITAIGGRPDAGVTGKERRKGPAPRGSSPPSRGRGKRTRDRRLENGESSESGESDEDDPVGSAYRLIDGDEDEDEPDAGPAPRRGPAGHKEPIGAREKSGRNVRRHDHPDPKYTGAWQKLPGIKQAIARGNLPATLVTLATEHASTQSTLSAGRRASEGKH